MNPDVNEQPCEHTSHYFWSPNDIIGVGSTADVYRSYRIGDGEIVAAKVFHPVQDKYTQACDQLEAGLKELATLQQLNHRNVIRLLDVDSTKNGPNQSAKRVLIMEYCFIGSLQAHLEKPENFYGLPEDDFATLFVDLAEGMQYLRSKNVIHRDIKPSNIMLQFDSRGKHTFKLADFGAAKQLFFDIEEGFQSLVGTAEYLPPPMFDYWMSRDRVPMFRAESELWTIGVTLYQSSTGQLPFRPYLGVRKDYPTMLRIVKNRPRGMLSGVQNAPKGPIEYQNDLPMSCRLSREFKKLFKPILLNLFDSQLDTSYKFDNYFGDCRKITNLIALPIFDTSTLEHTICYVNGYRSIPALLEQLPKRLLLSNGVKCLSNVQTEVLLFHKGLNVEHRFPSLTPDAIAKLGFITVQNPLISFNHQLITKDNKPLLPVTPDVSPIKRLNNVRDAFYWAREIVGNIHLMTDVVSQLECSYNLIQSASTALSLNIKERLLRATEGCTISTVQLTANGMEDQNFRETLLKCIQGTFTLPPILNQDMNSDISASPWNQRLICRCKYAHELLNQFEDETKLQRFSTERTCAHMCRRRRLEAIQEEIKSMLTNEFLVVAERQFKRWKDWVIDVYNPLSAKVNRLLNTCNNENVQSTVTQQSSPSASINGSLALSKSIDDIISSIDELNEKQESIDECIMNNEIVIKRIVALLVGTNKEISGTASGHMHGVDKVKRKPENRF